MNKNTIYQMITIAGLWIVLGACNHYLDEVPDNRTQINSPEKVALLLAGSYPGSTYAAFLNPRVDYVTDKGEGKITVPNEDSFFWRDVRSNAQDSPEYFWVECFYSIAGANGALDAIKTLPQTSENKADLNHCKGEALVLRAFNHFMLGTIFCRFYDPATNAGNMGLPYVVEQETEINRQYNRGNVAELWINIQRDLEEGLPLIGTDNKYRVAKYHFNRSAAYAFASRFYLYKGEDADLKRCIELSNTIFPKPAPVADGHNVPANDPATIFALSNFQPWTTAYSSVPSSNDIKQDYTRATNPSVLLIADVTSDIGSKTNTWRYATTSSDMAATVENRNPTGTSLSSGNWAYRVFHSGDYNYYCPKFNYFFKKNSVNAAYGMYHAVFPFFRIEEVLLNRAEAYARLGEDDNAIADLNIFCRTRIRNYDEVSHVITKQKILDFYASYVKQENFYMNKYNAFHSASWSNNKKALVHFIQVCRQNEFMYEGLRYFDMVRYKMEVTHQMSETAGGQKNTLFPDDDRWVIQLPESATLAGMKLNPRTNLLSPEW